MESPNGSTTIDLAALYAEVCAQLEDAERRASELRSQKQLLHRLIGMAQRPIMSGDPLPCGDAPDTAPPALE